MPFVTLGKGHKATLTDVTCTLSSTGEPMLMDQPVVASYYRAFSSGFAARCEGCIAHKQTLSARAQLKTDDDSGDTTAPPSVPSSVVWRGAEYTEAEVKCIESLERTHAPRWR